VRRRLADRTGCSLPTLGRFRNAGMTTVAGRAYALFSRIGSSGSIRSFETGDAQCIEKSIARELGARAIKDRSDARRSVAADRHRASVRRKPTPGVSNLRSGDRLLDRNRRWSPREPGEDPNC
jgi:hypothetical protein